MDINEYTELHERFRVLCTPADQIEGINPEAVNRSVYISREQYPILWKFTNIVGQFGPDMNFNRAVVEAINLWIEKKTVVALRRLHHEIDLAMRPVAEFSEDLPDDKQDAAELLVVQRALRSLRLAVATEIEKYEQADSQSGQEDVRQLITSILNFAKKHDDLLNEQGYELVPLAPLEAESKVKINRGERKSDYFAECERKYLEGCEADMKREAEEEARKAQA